MIGNVKNIYSFLKKAPKTYDVESDVYLDNEITSWLKCGHKVNLFSFQTDERTPTPQLRKTVEKCKLMTLW